jgi:CheY-like chemotaxis protein
MPGHTVVVIDDEPELLGLLRDILEGEGYRVVGVDHPMLIDTAIAGHDPSLFLIDIMLPGTSGITVAEQLRTGDHRRVPLVAMSASDLMLNHATRSGWFSGILEKPFDVEQLVSRVAQHLLPERDLAWSDQAGA